MRLGEVEEVGRRERGLERASRSEGAGQPQVVRIWLRSVINPDRLFHDQPGSIPPLGVLHPASSSYRRTPVPSQVQLLHNVHGVDSGTGMFL